MAHITTLFTSLKRSSFTKNHFKIEHYRNIIGKNDEKIRKVEVMIIRRSSNIPKGCAEIAVHTGNASENSDTHHCFTKNDSEKNSVYIMINKSEAKRLIDELEKFIKEPD